MQFRRKSVVFAVAAALGTALTVPGALALTSSSPSTTTTPTQEKTTISTVEEQHEADAAKTDEAARSEDSGTEHEQSDDTTTTSDTEKTDVTAHDGQPTPTTNVPGATGDAHRSDVAAQHSQADQHRAVAPGVPAQKAAGAQPATHGQAAAHSHH